MPEFNPVIVLVYLTILYKLIMVAHMIINYALPACMVLAPAAGTRKFPRVAMYAMATGSTIMAIAYIATLVARQ